MKTTYDIQFSLNLANVLPGVGVFTKKINAHLALMGHDEQITLRGRPIKMTLTLEREATEEEIAKVKDHITAQLCSSFPGSNPVCESFRRQSGQLVKQ